MGLWKQFDGTATSNFRNNIYSSAHSDNHPFPQFRSTSHKSRIAQNRNSPVNFIFFLQVCLPPLAEIVRREPEIRTEGMR